MMTAPGGRKLKQITEGFVKQQTIKWLNRHKWKIVSVKEKAEHGVDITACKIGYSRYYLIEAKGDPGKVKFPRSVRDNSFLNALGQILTRMNTQAGYYYGVALPKSYERLVFERIPWQVCKKLKLNFFLVDENGKVRHLTWKAIKDSTP